MTAAEERSIIVSDIGYGYGRGPTYVVTLRRGGEILFTTTVTGIGKAKDAAMREIRDRLDDHKTIDEAYGRDKKWLAALRLANAAGLQLDIAPARRA